MTPLRHWFRQAAIIGAITLFAVLFVGELALRLIGYEAPPFYRLDARFGWTLRPNLSTWYRDEGEALIETSSAGLRDIDHLPGKQPGVYRILVLGDSYAEALQVDRANTFWALLGDELASCPAKNARTIELLNFGVSSYGTANELLRLEGEGFTYEPDLVLLAFCLNDLQDNHPKLDHLTVKTRPYFVWSDNELILQPSQGLSGHHTLWQATLPLSRFAQLVERVRKNFQRRATISADAGQEQRGEEAGFPPELFRDELPPLWLESWNVTEHLLGRMQNITLRQRARLLAVTVPAGISVNPDDAVRAEFAKAVGATDLFAAERRLGEIASRLGIASLVLGPTMLERAKETTSCLYGFSNTNHCSGHWNEAGHRVASEIIAARICQLWTEEARAR